MGDELPPCGLCGGEANPEPTADGNIECSGCGFEVECVDEGWNFTMAFFRAERQIGKMRDMAHALMRSERYDEIDRIYRLVKEAEDESP